MVDCALFTLRDGRLCVGLLDRPAPPELGKPALVGGFIHVDEDADAEETARRVLRQKAGLADIFLEQLKTYSGMRRGEMRGWSICVAYYALVPETTVHEQGNGSLRFLPVDDLPALAFDHAEIVRDAVARLRSKANYSSLIAFLLEPKFTLSELQRVFEQVLGEKHDKSAFRKKVAELGMVEEIPGETRSAGGRPAQLYRRRERHLVQYERTTLRS
jgi:8-oxo-dGTP diphosphatase